jgi:lipoprotein-anchoring transpeptidase ErfK/SrfK
LFNQLIKDDAVAFIGGFMVYGSFRLSLLCGAGIFTIALLSTSAQAGTARHSSVATSHARGEVGIKLGQTYPAGTIVINVSKKKLYLVTGVDQAILYPVAVGKGKAAWTGVAYVKDKFVRPDWAPPAVVKHDNPNLPDLIPGGTPGNPMGERAITLSLDEIAIHGTSQSMRKSIGTAASYGCIRMLNEDVVDLFERISVGTPVVAIR